MKKINGYEMIKEFIYKLWDSNKEFVFHISGHGIKIVCTILILKLIYTISDLSFTEKPKIMIYMEDLSAFGTIAIFFILVIFDIYDIIIYSIKQKRNIKDEQIL